VKRRKIKSKKLLEKKMKNRKWLTYTVGVLLTLVVLAVVGAAGFRIGMTQNASFARPAFARNIGDAPLAMQGNSQNNDGVQQGNSQKDNGNQSAQGNFRDNGGPQAMQGNSRNQGFDNRGGDRRGGGMPFFAPIFGLIRLAVLGLLLWVVYKLVQKSGWRITRVQASPVPVATETSSAEVEEKKASE
jgi:hypothetical protein